MLGCGLSLGLGCSFQSAPITAGIAREKPPVSDDGDGDEPPDDGAPVGGPDAQLPMAGSLPPPPEDAGSIKDAFVPTDADTPMMDATVPKDASTQPDANEQPDATEPEDAGPDANDEPDATDPQCDCVCPHELVDREPGDCDAPLCPVAECAPEETCTTITRGRSGYYLCPDEHPWQDAQAHCAQVPGAELAAVDDKPEDDFLFSNIDEKFWIGGNDLEQEGELRWEDGTLLWEGTRITGSAVNNVYENFIEIEPNDLGLAEGSADCLILYPEEGGWADAMCEDVHGYICEFPVPMRPMP